jgi:hypothetical protein
MPGNKWIKIGKDVNGVYFNSFTVGKLNLTKNLNSIILVGSKGGEGFLVNNKKVLKSFKDKKRHTQLITRLLFNGGNEKWVSFSFTSSESINFNNTIKENKKLYRDVFLGGGFQYLNTNQALINNVADNFNCFVVEDTNISNNISEGIRDSILKDLQFYQDEEVLFLKEYNENSVLWLPDGQPLFFSDSVGPVLPIAQHINDFSEHLKSHTIIKDFTCRFCIEVMNFYTSPAGNILCNYFGFF